MGGAKRGQTKGAHSAVRLSTGEGEVGAEMNAKDINK